MAAPTQLPEIVVNSDGSNAPPAEDSSAWKVTSEEPMKGGGDWQVVKEEHDKSTALGQMGTGFMDPIEGGAQLLSHIMPEPVRNTINTFNNWVSKKTGLVAELPPGGMDQRVQEREAAIREYRGVNRDNIDWARMGGDLLNPMNYIGGGGIGGASKLVNIGRAGAAGLGASAVQPVADPDYWREKQKQAVIGTVFGLGTGAAASAVGQGLDAVGAYIARKKPQFLENEAVKKIVKRITQDQKAGGPSAQDMIDIVNAGNKPVTLADVGGANVKGLAGNVARQPGESRAIATQLIGKRDEAAAQRISQDIETYMHGGPSSYQTQEMLLQARSSASTPAYKDAYALKNIWSPRLQNFIDDPDFKKGLDRGWHLERLRALADGGRKITSTELGVDVDMESNATIIAVPNMRLLDMAKRGLDAMIADTRDPITGRLSAHGVALNQARHAYVRELEELDTSGAYKRARAAWEGPSASKDAVQLGRAVFQHSPEEMAAEVGKLSPANREFGRIGVADMLKERLAKTGLSGDEAKAIIKNPWMRDQLRPWFRSREEFDKFTDSISTETQMFETGRKMLGGSQTAERVAEDTSVENAYSAAKVMRDVTHGPWGAVRAAVDAWRLFRDLGRGNDPAFNEKIAHILFATQIKPEMASKLAGKTPLDLVNPLEKTGQTVSAAGVPSAAAVGVPQAQDRGIPRMAEGGVVTQPTVAMIGEKGPEAVVPLDDPAAAQQAADVAAARTRAPYAKAAARPTGLLEGLDELGGYFSNKLMSVMTAPYEALTGSLQVDDPVTGMPTPQAMQRGQGVANLAMTGGIPMAQRGALGMAGGKSVQPSLVVARRMPDGEIKTGKPGQVHSDLMSRQELSRSGNDPPEVAGSMGYAKDGKFLTRDEALAFAQKNEPERAAWSAQQPEFGLDAASYNEAMKPRAGGKLGGSDTVAGQMAGINFKVTPAQYEELTALRKTGAGKAEIQKKLDEFQGKSKSKASKYGWDDAKEQQYKTYRRGGTFRPYDQKEFETRVMEEMGKAFGDKTSSPHDALKLIEAKLEDALRGVDINGPVHRMDLALNPSLRERLPPDVRALADQHAQLSGAIDSQIADIDAALTQELKGKTVEGSPLHVMDVVMNDRFAQRLSEKGRELLARRRTLTPPRHER